MQRDIGTLHLELLHTQECNFQRGMCRGCICATAQYASYLLLVCKVALLWCPRWNFRIFTQRNATFFQICVQGAFVHFLFGRVADNQNGNLRWYLPLGVRPPLNGTNFQTFFYPTFFLLQLNPTYMKRILHFRNVTLKSSYNWFKIDIHQQLRPLTANYLAMFKVISTTIYT